jgi:hypothetical protein
MTRVLQMISRPGLDVMVGDMVGTSLAMAPSMPWGKS